MKLFYRKFLNLMFGIGALLSAGPAWGGTVIDRVVAVVNRDIITQGELDAAGQALKPTPLRPPVERDLLSQIIEKKLILQEANKRGVRLTDSELDLALKDIEERNHFPDREAFKRAVTQEGLSWEKYREDLKNQLTLLKLMNREVEANLLVREEEIPAYYDAHPEQFKLADQIRLKQILFRLSPTASAEQIDRARERAGQALAAAREGEDFDALAQQYSDGAERRKGGDLGFFKKGELAPEIDQIVFNLETGAISPIIRTDLGFHIFKAQDRQTGRRQPLEKVRKEAEERLLAEKREEARRRWLDDVWRRSFVELK